MNDEIEWLNSLEIPSCSLATTAEDLRSGVILCDLAAYIKSRSFFEEVLRHGEVQKNFKRASIHNFRIFLREIGAKLPNYLLKTPEELCENTEVLLEITKFLQKLTNSRGKIENVSPKPRISRNFTPRGRIAQSPSIQTSRNRLQHSPSMLDIRMQASKVPIHVKESIFNWLFEMKLIQNDVLEEFKDGVLLCELINRLEGKTEVIKGMHKTPKNRSAVQVNVNKALNYLRNIEKLNSKYL